jgi:hypothetical protein
MGSKKKKDPKQKVRVKTNGTRTSWGTDGGGGVSDPEMESPIPIVRIDQTVLRSALEGATIRLLVGEQRIIVLLGDRALGEVSGQHERRIRNRQVTAGTLAEVQHSPLKVTFYPVP